MFSGKWMELEKLILNDPYPKKYTWYVFNYIWILVIK